MLGELVQTTNGKWITHPPTRCPNGHTLGAGQVLVGHQPCLAAARYTVWSHVRHVHVVWPPPWPRHAWWRTSTWPAPRGCPFWQRVGGWVIHFPLVVCTRSPNTVESLGPGGDQSGAARRRHAGRSFSNTKMHSPAGVLYQ
jgi:hypothetical protein